MMRSYLAILMLAGVLSASAAIADDKMGAMNCTEADMATMQTRMEGMTEAGKKKMAMDEMSMAKKMMANKDMDGCKTHMGKAQEHMGMMDMMKK